MAHTANSHMRFSARTGRRAVLPLDHWARRGMAQCARDLPTLQPTPGATVIRVRHDRVDGQSLAGSGVLVWEGEAAAPRH